MTLADLMDPAPRPWGLRGDPLLFDAMKAAFAGIPLPDTKDQVAQMFTQTFEAMTGTALDTAPDHLQVAVLKRPNGGMSNGMVSSVYWRDQMRPALIRRFAAR